MKNGSAVYIWGLEEVSNQAIKCLKKNLHFAGYLDNNSYNCGKTFNGKKIYTIGALQKTKDYVIITPQKYDDIYQTLLDTGINKNQIVIYNKLTLSDFKNTLSLVKYTLQTTKDTLKVKFKFINKILKSLKRKYGLHWGIKKTIKSIKAKAPDHKFAIIGTCKQSVYLADKISGIIKDKFWGITTLNPDINSAGQWNVRSFDELFYEDPNMLDVYILEPFQTRKLIGTLLDMGIPQKNLKILGEDLFCGTKVLDVYDGLLGYTRDDDLPGFTVFGKTADNQSQYSIVTLGGSTTDPTLGNIMSWSEMLYNKLQKMGINAKIYCGGLASYTSTQELMKLMRDVLELNPDLVISYSGANDAVGSYYEEHHPFILKYQKDLGQKVVNKGYVVNTLQWGYPISKYTSGVKNSNSIPQHWIKCERMMHSICEEFGIGFLGFLQPHNTEWPSPLAKEISEFYETVTQELKNEHYQDWLLDLTHIFDGKENIYVDRCHVYEKGNDIIARMMLPHILKIKEKQKCTF